MKKTTYFSNSTRVSDDEDVKPAKRWFGKRRVYVDKRYDLRYDMFPTYEENRQDFLTTERLVFSGKYPTIFAAYDATRNVLI